jgi:lipid II:glycine glycyltransferase (peptidoglycan interpeptide bridge formation enzyme)
MIEVTTHAFPGFSRKEIWFYNGEPYEPAVYTVFSAAQVIPEGKSIFLEKYTTSMVRLTCDEQLLFNAIHPTYRYDIRSAEKQGITTRLIFSPSKEECLELVSAYEKFAAERKLRKLQISWLLGLRKQGCLCITMAVCDGKVLATHIYIYDTNYASLAASFHNVEFENDKIRSAANKLLHWQDMRAFKEKGISQYDFGGINPQKHPGISKFKMSFGGTTVENFRCIKTSSLIFKLVSFLKRSR